MNATSFNPSKLTLRRAVRLGLAVLGLGLGLALPAVTQAAAPASPIPFTQALQDARRVALMRPDWFVVLAQGGSMAPQFGNNSILLVARTPFEDLRPGMVVIYRDGAGDLVAHRLLEKSGAGWVVKGMNNAAADPGLVTAQNVQGVIFGMLHYKPGSADLAALAPAARPPVAYAKTY